MRQSLMNTFDEIYILDLHGNSLKKEKAPDGSKDENVFDIQQGVAISIFIKKEIAAPLSGVRNDDNNNAKSHTDPSSSLIICEVSLLLRSNPEGLEIRLMQITTIL